MMPENEHYDSTTQAGEYVLGTLEGEERAEFERRLRDDIRLQEEVDAWQQRFAPMLEGIDPVSPPDAVWQAVETRLTDHGQNDTRTATGTNFWDSLSFWRNLGMVAATLVLAFGVMLMTQQPETGMNNVLVVMNDQDRTGWVVAAKPDHGFVNVSAVEPSQLPAGKACQLWMEDQHGNLHPVGVLPHDGRHEMPLPMMPKSENVFKVSVEEMDDMPTEKPHGEIVFEGKLTEI
ncbi:MAG: anti-sigma factor [Candidatus Thiodiazotropha sp. 'RUGA']|nr:anti-sigma factor [Candidatus Thiodiazotropha sp. 'RUGA']